MRFGDVAIGARFFEGHTGEYHLKLDEVESVVVCYETGKQHGNRHEFPADHEVEPDEE